MRSFILWCLFVGWSVFSSLYAANINLPSCQTECKCMPIRCGLNGSCIGHSPLECCSGKRDQLQYCGHIGPNKACLSAAPTHCALYCDDVHTCNRL